jgi:hypothetical protein
VLKVLYENKRFYKKNNSSSAKSWWAIIFIQGV